jgi:hypothetical protein
MSLPVLRKLKEFVDAGMTVIGTRPDTASGLSGFPESDAEVKRLADELWGSGRVIFGSTARDALKRLNVKPDFESEGLDNAEINFIHRQDGNADIYFVAFDQRRGTELYISNCRKSA